MLKNRKIINIVSIAFAVVLCVSIVTPAFASPLSQRVSAWIGSMILASNMTLEATVLPLQYDLQQRMDPYNVYITQIEEDYYDNLDKSTIKILPNSTIIDGVQYSDVWLSKDAANKFKTDGADFYTAYGIASNTRGTYADGTGYLDGIPVYDINGSYQTPYYNIPSIGTYNIGNLTLEFYQSSGRWCPRITFSDGTVKSGGWLTTPYGIRGRPTGMQGTTIVSASMNVSTKYTGSGTIDLSVPGNLIDNSDFEFNYQSGVIDLEPLENGLLIRVPSIFTDPNTGTSYDIPSFVQDNPRAKEPTGTNIELDPSINPDFLLDKDFLDDLGDLINTILNVLDLLNRSPNSTITDSPMPDAPVPPEPEPPIPEPGTTISDTDYSILDNLLRWIKRAIDSVKTAINNLNSTIETLFDSFLNVLDSIKNTLEDILQSLSDLPQTILEDIEKGPIRLFDKAIDALKNIFAPIIAFIKLHLGIWHYVVEWITSIIGVFTFFFNLMSSTSYNLVLPIYALIAGTICIAVYKNFGR